LGSDFAGFKGWCSKLSLELGGAPVFFPNYRFCPEWTVKERVDDLQESLAHMQQKYPHLPIVLACDSGGAVHAFAVASLAKYAP
jgi:acetyl esterase/lipase